MGNKALLPGVLLIFGFAAVVALSELKPQPTPQATPSEPALLRVEVAPVRQQNLRLKVFTQGSVQARRQIDLVSQVSGEVLQVDKSFVGGGFFQAQQALLHIDDHRYRVAVAAAEAQLAQAKYRLAEEQGLSRQARRQWSDRGDDNANQLYLRQPQLQSAKADVAAAEAELQQAKINLTRCKIIVPFNGRILDTTVDLGSFVSVGSPLARVYDTSIFEVRLPLSEQQAALVDLPLLSKQRKKQAQGTPEVIIKAEVAGQDYRWQGSLTRSEAFVDQGTRMYYAIAEIKQPNSANAPPLLPGLFVDAEIQGKALEEVVELPRQALFQRDKVVYLQQDNTVRHVTVEVLNKYQDKVWLRTDLQQNTLIALEKQSLMGEGRQVHPLSTNAAQAEAELSSVETTAMVLDRAHE